jgi:hypothetical protein
VPFTADPGPLGDRLRVLGCAPLIAGAIRALHYGTAVSDLPTGAPRLVPFSGDAP